MAVLTANTQYNLKNARDYFEEQLCVGDYYDEGRRVSGEWRGFGRLTLGSDVIADVYAPLFGPRHTALPGRLGSGGFASMSGTVNDAPLLGLGFVGR